MNHSARTIADRYERDVAAHAAEATKAADQRWRVPANMPQPKPVHLAVMQAVDRVLSLGLGHPNVGDAPMPLRTLVRGMRRLEPLMLEQLATVPEEECVRMMRTLATGITQLADSVDTEKRGHLAVVPAGPGADQPPRA